MSYSFFIISCIATFIVMIVTLAGVTQWFNSERASLARAIIATLVIGVIIYCVSRSVNALNSQWIYAVLILLIPYIIVLILKTDLRHGFAAAILTIIAGIMAIYASAAICSMMSNNQFSISDCFTGFKNRLESGVATLPDKDELAQTVAYTLTHQNVSPLPATPNKIEATTPLKNNKLAHYGMHTVRMNEFADDIQQYCDCNNDTSCQLQKKVNVMIAFESLESQKMIDAETADFALLQKHAANCALNLPAYEATPTQTTAIQAPSIQTTPTQETTVNMTPQPTVVSPYQTIAPSQAPQYIGSDVRVTLNIDGSVREGQLIAADSNALTIEMHYSAGVMQSKIPVNMIKQFEVKQ